LISCWLYMAIVLLTLFAKGSTKIDALSQSPLSTGRNGSPVTTTHSRRSVLHQWMMATAAATLTPVVVVLLPSTSAQAAADCYMDCLKNCKTIAPMDSAYCQDTCSDYCAQPDRKDGLSGSVSSEEGEVGILGGTFGTGTVVKGEDKPPAFNVPGLDFTNTQGRKLLGY
jgi:hypothetical protein